MDAPEPLIITSNDPMILTGPREIDETVEQGIAAVKADAAIIHHHLIYKPYIRGNQSRRAGQD